MEHLITKYINNELTKEEWEDLRAWLDENHSNKSTFNMLLSYASNTNLEANELEEIVWKELRNRRGVRDISRFKVGHTSLYKYYKVAAIILIVATFSMVSYKLILNSNTFEEVQEASIVERYAPEGSKVTTRLPDGSMVTLNSGSRITFPERFTGDMREVNLTGEAFFEVEHDPERAFFVKMNGDKVRVLGTSFNIRSYPEDNVISVSVATGKVSYTVPSGQEVILVPDEMVTFHPQDGSLVKGEVDKLQAFGWKDRILYFKGSTFKEIIQELTRWYGVDIKVNGDFVNDETYSAEFQNATLLEVLNSLSFVYRFDFEIEGIEVLITQQ